MTHPITEATPVLAELLAEQDTEAAELLRAVLPDWPDGDQQDAAESAEEGQSNVD